MLFSISKAIKIFQTFKLHQRTTAMPTFAELMAKGWCSIDDMLLHLESAGEVGPVAAGEPALETEKADKKALGGDEVAEAAALDESGGEIEIKDVSLSDDTEIVAKGTGAVPAGTDGAGERKVRDMRWHEW